MKYLIISFLCLLSVGITQPARAQEERLSAFDYVVVPERFDFQYERDQYQFNSLLKFLFNKNGFHAYFPDELPDVSRCDGLYADIQHESGFVWTELSVRLLDCDGILFYQTKPGRSKLKDFAKIYQQALRMAFESIEILGVRQGELEILQKADARQSDSSVVSVQSRPKRDRPFSPQANKVVEQEEKTIKDPAVTLGLIPDVAMMSFAAKQAKYLLRRTDLGYQWYLERGPDLIYQGKFFVVENILFYEDKDQIRYLAEFTKDENLILDRDGQKEVFEKLL